VDAIWEPEVEVIVILDQHSLVTESSGNAIKENQNEKSMNEQNRFTFSSSPVCGASPPSCEKMKRKKWDYQPIRSLCDDLCFVEQSGLVRMSAQLRLKATLLMVMLPFLTWSILEKDV